DEHASYVSSAIEIPKSSHTDKVFATAKLTLDIRHTYKSDLRVELLTPAGESVMIHDSEGGHANDIIETPDVTLPATTRGAGTWRLVVSDHAGLDTGTLDRGELALGDPRVASKDTPIFIPDAPETGSDAGVASISIGPPAIPTWTARLGQVI